VSLTNGGSPWYTAARLDVHPTDSKQFEKTSKQTMYVKRVRFTGADKVGGLPQFSEHVSDDEFVQDKQPNEYPPALPEKLAESVDSSYSISLPQDAPYLGPSQPLAVFLRPPSSVESRYLAGAPVECSGPRSLSLRDLHEIFSTRSSTPSCPAVCSPAWRVCVRGLQRHPSSVSR
jgi:hypothetical protein